MKINGRTVLFTFILIILTTACKYFFGPDPVWSGFSPVIAIALFAGFMIRKKDMSFLLPLLALLISDAILQILYIQDLFKYSGFYSGQWKNYLVLMTAVLIGWKLKGRKASRILAGIFAAPTVFFLISNFLVWISSEVVYAKSFSGLMSCYEAGLPFYKNSIIATLFFMPVILFTFNYLARHRAKLTFA
jgi:hypothetical protein